MLIYTKKRTKSEKVIILLDNKSDNQKLKSI